MAFDPLGERSDFTFRQSGFAHGIDPDRPLETTCHMRRQLGSRRYTQDHARTRFVDPTLAITLNILKRRICRDQRQQLCCIRPLHRLWRDTEGQRIESDRINEPAPPAISLVLRPRITVIIVFGQPMRGRHIRQQVASLEHITPEPGHIPAPWEDRAHAYNGNRCGGF